MSTIQTNAIIDASGGNTATVNGVRPTSDSLKGHNLFMNGDFQVWQRGTSLTHTSDQYLADRWKVTPPATANTTSAQVFDTTLQQNTLKITINQAGYIQFQSAIEGFKWAHNKTITVSFWAKADTNMRCTFNKRLYHAGGSVVLTTSPVQSITTTLTKFTVTFPADDLSSYTEDGSSRLQFGWTVNSPSNGNLASGNDFYIGQAKAEIGDVATSFQSRSYGEELVLCQRYYERIEAGASSSYIGWSAGTIYGSGTYLGHFTASVPMRVTPTFSTNAYSNASRMSVVSGNNTYEVTSIVVTGINQRLRINAAGALSGIIGQGAYIQIQNGYHVAFTAEL
jgi:hypothetical protein